MGERAAVDLDEHDRTCDKRAPQSSWRWWLCPLCQREVDTFGGNVA